MLLFIIIDILSLIFFQLADRIERDLLSVLRKEKYLTSLPVGNVLKYAVDIAYTLWSNKDCEE